MKYPDHPLFEHEELEPNTVAWFLGLTPLQLERHPTLRVRYDENGARFYHRDDVAREVNAMLAPYQVVTDLEAALGALENLRDEGEA